MIRSMSAAKTPDVFRIDRTPVKTPISGAAGVVSTFIVVRPPGCSRATSVNVPPMSTARRAAVRAVDIIPQSGGWSRSERPGGSAGKMRNAKVSPEPGEKASEPRGLPGLGGRLFVHSEGFCLPSQASETPHTERQHHQVDEPPGSQGGPRLGEQERNKEAGPEQERKNVFSRDLEVLEAPDR